MTTKAATANGISRTDTHYLSVLTTASAKSKPSTRISRASGSKGEACRQISGGSKRKSETSWTVLKQLFDYVQQLVFLGRDTQKNREDIEGLRR